MHRNAHATFILSLDCELSWGMYRSGGVERFSYLKNGYLHFYDQLLNLLERSEIRATFAFVAAIALSSEEFRARTEYLSGSDYKNSLEVIFNISHEHPTQWHGAQMIRKVIHSHLKHEIASHSFIHLPFNCILDSRTAQSELDQSYAILSALSGKGLTTFIFPENQIRYLEIIKASPYKIYRGRDQCWYGRLPFKRLLHFLDQLLPLAPNPVVLQIDRQGNYYLPGSLMLFAYDGLRRVIPDSIRFLKIKRGIDRAIQEEKIFHLWFHPWNLGSSQRMARVLEKVLSYVAQKRDEGLLSISTLGEVIPSS